MPLQELFFQIGLVLIIAATLSMMVFRFRLPLIIAYIITGVLVGPSLLSITQDSQIFQVMSEIGVAFLLFTVGLGLNWKSVKDVGGIALATGIGQVLFTSIIGFGIGLLLGFSPLTSIYLSVAFAFSSTIIIIKLLSDKEETESLYGRISIGFLLVQDFVAMFILLGLNALKGHASLESVFFSTLIKAILLIPCFWIVSVKILPRLLAYVARSQELLTLFAISWCFLIAGILVFLGFGVEIGALIAGITLSGSFYQREISARVRPLRDFFLIIFFIILGTHLSFSGMSGMIPAVLGFSAFILFGNPLIVLLIMRLLGYHPRTGFLAGTTVAQISEFSFIVIASGITIGHLSGDVLTLATSVGLLTIAGSAYLIERNEQLYDKLEPFFKWLEPKRTLKEELKKNHKPTEIILFGHHRTGAVVLETIQEMRKSYLVVDFDPSVIRHLSEQGIPNIYGDGGDENFLDEIRADKSKLIISTIPNVSVSGSLLTFLRARKFGGVVVVSVRTHEEAQECYDLGATYVIVPSILSGKKFSEILQKSRAQKTVWDRIKKEIALVTG